MPDIFDGQCPKPNRITDGSAAIKERDRARKAIAGFATDAGDLRHLLTVLALWPDDDEDAFAARNKPLLSRADRMKQR